MKMLKITLDNNCLINLLDTNSESATSVDSLREIIRQSHASIIDLAISTRVESDLENDKNSERRKEMMNYLKMFPVIGTVSRTVEGVRILDDIQKIVFPGGLNNESSSFNNKKNDIDHLFGHLQSERDIFITDDKGILKKAEGLETIGIIVMSPSTLVEYLEKLEISRQKIRLYPELNNPIYSNKNLTGTVSFNYSNNDSTYNIGKGIYLFETKWSKADDVSIHAYNDMPSVESIALAKNVDNLESILDFTAFDYTSRTRTVTEKDILILRNVNGISALIKITRIEDDTRGSTEDLLEFSYKILTKESPNF